MRDIIRCGLAMIVCFGALAGSTSSPRSWPRPVQFIGAISVLILFAIMLTQTKAAPSRLVFQTQAVPAAIAAAVLALILALVVTATDWHELGQLARTATADLARVLFNDFVLPFEVVSVLLLAAVIGGVYLARREPAGREEGSPS